MAGGAETPTIPHTHHRCQTNKCQTGSSKSANNEAGQATLTMTKKTFPQDGTCRRKRAYERRAQQRGRSTRSHFTPPKGFACLSRPLARTYSFSHTRKFGYPKSQCRFSCVAAIAPTPPLLSPLTHVGASTVRRVSTRQVSPALRFAASIIATGLIAGLVGRACTLLLHGVEIIV